MARRAMTALLVSAGLVAGVLYAPPTYASPETWGSAVRLDSVEAVVGDARTAYAVLGPDSPVPLLLLNGTASPMSQWDPALLQALSRTRRVIAYDYPGLGSSTPLARISFNALADHADALLARLGVEQADILGWSMGGFVAQRLAARHPSRIRALVLAGTNPGGPSAVLGPAWVQREDSDADSSARRYVRANYPPGARERGWAFVRRVNLAIDEGRFPPDHVPASTYEAMVLAEDPWLSSDENRVSLARLSLPTLVITGARDVVTPPANSRMIAAAIPGARLAIIAGAGHSFLFQEPARVARTVEVFLDSVS